MRYHYEKPHIYVSMYGYIYTCEHPIYDECTLYTINQNGLAVIQQRFQKSTKTTFWSYIDPWLVDDIYVHPKFKEYFDTRSAPCEKNLYPTVTIRQLMWALKMKPLPKESWETVFDRPVI